MTNYRGKPQRQLTEEDIASWDAQHMQKPPKTAERIRYEIKRANPVRFWRLQQDLAWLKREARKRGMNPEDARWLL